MTETKSAIGVVYTPEAIATSLVSHSLERILAGKTPQQITNLYILDPACGTGSLLIPAYHYLLNWYSQYSSQPLNFQQRQQILLQHIYGVDIDTTAVEITQRNLCQICLQSQTNPGFTLETNCKTGNAIIDFNWLTEFPRILQTGGFDLILSNPPYVDAAWMSSNLPQWRSYCKQSYQTASGNWDLFCIFIELALNLCKAQGLTGFIVPNKLASARYATATRKLLAEQNRLLSIYDYSQIPLFSAHVYPLVYIAQKQSPQRCDRISYHQMQLNSNHQIECTATRELDYSRYFSNSPASWQIFSDLNALELIERLQHQFPPLHSIAQVYGAATVTEAYQIQSLITNSPLEDKNNLKLVNSGTIDCYQLLWGQKTLRYLGQTYQHPIISSTHQNQLPAKRLQQAQTPKIILAGLAKILEAAVDLTGEVLAGKSTVIIFSQLDLRYLLALLNSPLLSFYYRCIYGGDSLQGGYLRVGVQQVRSLPIALPSPDSPLSSLVNQLLLNPNSPNLNQQIHQEICQLYQLTTSEITLVEQNSHENSPPKRAKPN